MSARIQVVEVDINQAVAFPKVYLTYGTTGNKECYFIAGICFHSNGIPPERGAHSIWDQQISSAIAAHNIRSGIAGEIYDPEKLILAMFGSQDGSKPNYNDIPILLNAPSIFPTIGPGTYANFQKARKSGEQYEVDLDLFSNSSTPPVIVGLNRVEFILFVWA